MALENKSIDNITKLISDANEVIFKYQDSHKESTEGERLEADSIRKKLDEMNNTIDDK